MEPFCIRKTGPPLWGGPVGWLQAKRRASEKPSMDDIRNVGGGCGIGSCIRLRLLSLSLRIRQSLLLSGVPMTQRNCLVRSSASVHEEERTLCCCMESSLNSYCPPSGPQLRAVGSEMTSLYPFFRNVQPSSAKISVDLDRGIRSYMLKPMTRAFVLVASKNLCISRGVER